MILKEQTLASTRQLELYKIGIQMEYAGIAANFITAAVQTAIEYEGVYDLMKMWGEETQSHERDEITADIQDMIDDCQQKGKQEAPYVRFDDLDKIAQDIRGFKDTLRLVVEEKGGITYLAALTGIPQPSLSRFFNSGSMPRRVTLLKIARALQLDALQIATEWNR